MNSQFSAKRKKTVVAVAIIVPILLAVALGYRTGVLQTFGYESKEKSSRGLSSSESGLSLGFKSLYLAAGTVFFADYDVEVKAGSFNIQLIKSSGEIGKKPHFHHQVEQTSQGELTFHITESGWYDADFDGSVLGLSPPGSGYDVHYTVRWGVR